MTRTEAIAIWKEFYTNKSQLNIIITDSRREALGLLLQAAASLEEPSSVDLSTTDRKQPTQE